MESVVTQNRSTVYGTMRGGYGKNIPLTQKKGKSLPGGGATNPFCHAVLGEEKGGIMDKKWPNAQESCRRGGPRR